MCLSPDLTICPLQTGACREGWVSFQNSCYLLSTTILTWDKAEEQCQTLGGHLVVLNNVEELVRFNSPPVCHFSDSQNSDNKESDKASKQSVTI